MALHWKIMIGMILGVIFGISLSYTKQGPEFISDWIKPFGTIFIYGLAELLHQALWCYH